MTQTSRHENVQFLEILFKRARNLNGYFKN